METIQIKRLREDAVLPKRGSAGAAGMDLCACLEKPLTIEPGALCKIPTGIAIALPNENCAAFLFARSGLGVKHGICLSNGVGVVDSDYRGEIQVGLCNIGREAYTVQPGERIAQMRRDAGLYVPTDRDWHAGRNRTRQRRVRLYWTLTGCRRACKPYGIK